MEDKIAYMSSEMIQRNKRETSILATLISGISFPVEQTKFQLAISSNFFLKI